MTTFYTYPEPTPTWHDTPMADPAVGQTREKGRRSRLGEQDRPNGLGIDGERRALPGSDSRCWVGIATAHGVRRGKEQR